MNLRFFCAALLIVSPTLLLSQIDIADGSHAITNQNSTSQSGQLMSLEGKMAAEDGSSVRDAVVILTCGNNETARANVDHDGEFVMSITLIDSSARAVPEKLPAGSVTTQSWGECELYGDAPGYESERLRMVGAPQMGVIRVGTIILHLVSRPVDDSSTVSVTSLAAPAEAKKDFTKGEEQERKGKWSAACEYFKKAIQVYPHFALAWLELGRTQVKQNDLTGARQSFHEATEQDPHLLDGYVQTATLAVQQKQWKDLRDSTEHLVELSPDATPNFWLLNSAANYNLGNVAEAETSATRGLRLDTNHRVPQLEYLYGMILARRGNYKAAVEHMQTYLRLSPHASDAVDAQNKLAQLQKLAASDNLATR
jgi:Tetratricopeptide repeat